MKSWACAPWVIDSLARIFDLYAIRKARQVAERLFKSFWVKQGPRSSLHPCVSITSHLNLPNCHYTYTISTGRRRRKHWSTSSLSNIGMDPRKTANGRARWWRVRKTRMTFLSGRRPLKRKRDSVAAEVRFRFHTQSYGRNRNADYIWGEGLDTIQLTTSIQVYRMLSSLFVFRVCTCFFWFRFTCFRFIWFHIIRLSWLRLIWSIWFRFT